MSPSDNIAVLTETIKSTANATIKDEGANQHSREHGWSEPEKYDYESYSAGTRKERETIEALHEVPVRALNAMKYERTEGSGGVGPEHTARDEMLFKDENRLESRRDIAS